ncbi:MAG TPA: PrgI family protein [Candidatus Paceibacterota bacterium]|nr:PrgI family protein [Candidatus Paceibacterota bacterium]
MEYQVPQFIEVEDKIFGPLTLKQFIYIAGGAGLVVVIMLNLPFMIGLIVSIPVAGLAAAFAFYKVNGKPFPNILEYAFSYYLGRRLYLWRREEKPVTPNPSPALQRTPTPAESVLPHEGLSRRKLSELAWSLDVKDTAPPQP